MPIGSYVKLEIPHFSASKVSAEIAKQLKHRVDLSEIELQLNELRSRLAAEVLPVDIEDKITNRKFPLKNLPSILNTSAQYLTPAAVALLSKAADDRRISFTTPLFKCRYWRDEVECCHFDIMNPMTIMAAAINSRINDNVGMSILQSFFDSINFSDEDKQNYYHYRTPQQKLYRGLKDCMDRFKKAKANTDLIKLKGEDRVWQIPYGELFIEKIFKGKSWGFDDVVLAYSALASAATRQIQKWYLDRFRYGHGHSDYGCKRARLYKRMTKTEYLRGGRLVCAEMMEEFIAISKEMVRYTTFNFGETTSWIGDALVPASQLVETAAMTKVDTDAQFVRADFKNFCQAVEGIPDESFLRDNKLIFESCIGIFQIEFVVIDEGLITKWRR